MAHFFPSTCLLAIILSCTSGCQGCRENSSSPNKPVEQETDLSTPEDVQREESSHEAETAESEESEDGAEKNDSESSANSGDLGQAGDSGSGVASTEGNQSTGSNGQGSGLGAPSTASSDSNDSGSGNSGASQPTLPSPKFESPEAALTFANRQREKSSKFSKSGDTAEAYEQALLGWQSLQPHLSDEGCGKLSGDLLGDLEKYGEGLGTKGIPVIGKPLKIK